MEHDCIKYVRSCQQCQIYADKEKVLIPLNNMTTPWPFSMCGISMSSEIWLQKLPMLHPSGNLLLHQMGWLKSRLMQIKIKKVEIHSKQHHSQRPNDIITDNATNLNNDMMYPTFQNSFVNSEVSWYGSRKNRLTKFFFFSNLLLFYRDFLT